MSRYVYFHRTGKIHVGLGTWTHCGINLNEVQYSDNPNPGKHPVCRNCARVTDLKSPTLRKKYKKTRDF